MLCFRIWSWQLNFRHANKTKSLQPATPTVIGRQPSRRQSCNLQMAILSLHQSHLKFSEKDLTLTFLSEGTKFVTMASFPWWTFFCPDRRFLASSNCFKMFSQSLRTLCLFWVLKGNKIKFGEFFVQWHLMQLLAFEKQVRLQLLNVLRKTDACLSFDKPKVNTKITKFKPSESNSLMNVDEVRRITTMSQSCESPH